MAQINAMKQIGVKNMGFKVELMEWSNKMDLIAIGNEKGEVIIQRLNWQKICSFSAPGENIKVRALSWQPDETVVAIAYSNGRVSLFDVEKEDEIYSFILDSDIKTLQWTRSVHTSAYTDSYNSKSEVNNENFLVPLPNLSSLSSGAKKTDYTSKSFTKGSPNFLIISLITGEICLSVLGVLQCGKISIQKYLLYPQNYEISDVRMNFTFDEVMVYVRDGPHLKVLIFNNDILTKYTSSLLNLAMKHGHILECFNYTTETIQCITEAWETVLLEMDNKLTKYANSQTEGSVSADFLELLMFGSPSEALEQFLTRYLTEKGLKKLGNSIELSYSTIQNLVVRPLQSAAINLFYHLNILKGLSRNTYCYKALITPEMTEKALLSAGSFLIKILELQQTVDQSVNDYKIFWCWLCIVVVRLMDENVPDEVASVTQEDITYLAEFLNNFDDCIFEKEDGTLGKRKFNLERVGQYLENADLEFPPKLDGHHQWNKLLNENECLRESGLIFPHHKNYSLIQELNNLKKHIFDLFAKPDKIIEEHFILKCSIKCADLKLDQPIYTSYIVDENTKSDLIVASISDTGAIFIELNSKSQLIKSSKLNLVCGPFTPNKFKIFNQIIFKNLKFYNESILSVLLQASVDGKLCNYFVQLPIGVVREKCSIHQPVEQIDLSLSSAQYSILDLIDPNYLKPIEGFCCSAIAVSGSRKVASVLSDNHRKIRVYEMEIEDDDDEVEMSQNSVLDSSKESMQSQD